jgi:hypothetical protein
LKRTTEELAAGIRSRSGNRRDDLRSDLNQADEQSQQSAEKQAVQPSQPANPMHPRDRRFYVAVALATVAAGFALSCFVAGASKQLDWIWAICGIVVGLLLTILATLDALEKRVSFENTGPITIGIAAVRM